MIRSGSLKKPWNLKTSQSVLDLLPTWSNKNLLQPNKSGCGGQWSAALLTTLPFLISYGCSNNTVRLLCCRMLFCAIFPLNGTNLITINQFEKKITALAESSERDLVALGPISAHFYGHPMRAMYTKKRRRKVILSRGEHESRGRKVV